MQQPQIISLGGEDALEKEMASHSRILAWEISWTEDPGWLYSLWGCKEVNTSEQLNNNDDTVLLLMMPLHMYLLLCECRHYDDSTAFPELWQGATYFTEAF